MASHNGRVLRSTDDFLRQNVYLIPNLDDTKNNSIENEYPKILFGQHTKTIIEKKIKIHRGRVIRPYFDGMLDTIYIEPQDIDAGFITEEKKYDIKIWNAYRENKTIISINAINPEGTIYSIENETPILLTRMISINSVMTILLDGLAIQNTTYNLAIGLKTFAITVIGKRLRAFPYEPNWRDPVKIKYRYITVINRNEQFFEQRRALRTKPIIILEALFSFKNTLKNKIINDLQKFLTGIVAIPIYSEALLISGDLLNQTTINLKENSDKFYNFQRLNLALVIDIKNIENTELKEVKTKTSTTVEFISPISHDIKENHGVYYPCFVGMIESFGIMQETQSYVEISIKFKEVRLG